MIRSSLFQPVLRLSFRLSDLIVRCFTAVLSGAVPASILRPAPVLKATPRKREYGTCAWPGLAELRLRPLAIAPSSSGAGRIIPGVADGPSATLLS